MNLSMEFQLSIKYSNSGYIHLKLTPTENHFFHESVDCIMSVSALWELTLKSSEFRTVLAACKQICWKEEKNASSKIQTLDEPESSKH